MNWSRYIKWTAVRRVVLIFVGLTVYALLSAFGVARAQQQSGCGSFECTIEQAYAAWNQQANSRCAGLSGSPSTNILSGPNRQGQWFRGTVRCEYQGGGYTDYPISTNFQGGCPAGTEWRDDLKMCAGRCEGLGPREYNRNTSIWGAPPGEACVSGCAYSRDASSTLCTLVEEGPTAGYWCNMIFQPTGGTCEAGEDLPPPDPDAPDAACSADEVRLPDGQCSPRGNCPLGQHEVNGECHPTGSCPTGTVKAPDGSCAAESCPVNFVRGPDGTCKIDDNNDGEPDEDEPGDGGDGDTKNGNKFSGGDSCSVPPACSGDPVMCGQARIQWRIDCNTRTASGAVGGDHCDSFNMPICVGEHCDPVENKQMILQWRAMCALESLVNQEGGEGEGGGDDDFDSYGAGEGDAMALGDGGLGGAEGIFDETCDGEDCPSGSLDRSGYGYASSCPPPPQFNFGGRSFVIDTGPMCDWLQLGSYFVLLLAGLASARIINGGT